MPIAGGRQEEFHIKKLDKMVCGPSATSTYVKTTSPVPWGIGGKQPTAWRVRPAKEEHDMGLTIQDILTYLPHRYPFLLVDRVIAITDTSIVGIKNVTVNEPFFQGHFPGLPIMPGVLILEAMAQVSGLHYLQQIEHPEQYVFYFAGLNNVKFRKPVTPGDQLRMEIEILRSRKNSCKTQGTALVDGELAAEAEIFIMADVRDK
jgi:beta-hydroxyacyl-ACP dehydratase FabZ